MTAIPRPMVGRFGELAADILRWYGRRWDPRTREERVPFSSIGELQARWGARRVERKIEELYCRGYLELGAANWLPRGPLTDKGRAALAEIDG